MSQAFDGLRMPLHGTRLIEASAGTGKTFSLAGLFLRLLIEQQLDIREILVMTFTRAATRELRERIRERLNHAAALASGECEGGNSAEAQFAQALFEASKIPRAQLARQLHDAARRMDEAVILTIHSFSQRAGAEQAFESGLPFDRGEPISDSSLYRELIQDYWRQRVVGEYDQAFLAQWPTPDELHKDLSDALNNPTLKIANGDSAVFDRTLRAARELWASEGSKFIALLRTAAVGSEQSKPIFIAKMKKKLANSDALEKAIEEIHSQLQNEMPALPAWLSLLADPKQYAAAARDQAGLLLREHKLLKILLQLDQLLPARMLSSARMQTSKLASQRKAQRGQFSFSDMITVLHQAICADNGEALAQKLHSNWPWALVDEFQDTDPQQYEILHRIYAGRDHGGLILIGDPKQAIYSFRGGDVHTYLKAAHDARAARYHLDSNFRSSASCLSAFETLFRTAGNNPFLIPQIDFDHVKAGRSDTRSLLLDNACHDGINFWHYRSPDDKALSKQAAETACQQACIVQVRTLLDSASIRRETQAETSQTRVKKRDIAILVNTNDQASKMQVALARSGVAAVCVHQQSVFESREAEDVLAVLLAVSQPANEGLIRGALTTPLFGARLSELIRWRDDEASWNQQLDTFSDLHELWQKHGVLAMLLELLQASCQRLQSRLDADRCLSNYLQLSELLADAQAHRFGMSDLIRWLEIEISNAAEDRDKESAQLRLESDEELVRILTVHKSKGLEFPIVLLPYAPWLGSGGSRARTRRYHDEHGQALLAIKPGDEQKALADIEKQAEAIRLLYVALTRAELACYVPFGHFSGALDGPVASLMMRGQHSTKNKLGADDISQALDELSSRSANCIRCLQWPEQQPQVLKALFADTQDLAPARTDTPRSRDKWKWRINSFSGLLKNANSELAEAGAYDETSFAEDASDDKVEKLAELPGGVNFGNAVHDILENLDAQTWAAFPLNDTETLQELERAMLRHGVVLPQQPIAREGMLLEISRLIANGLDAPLHELGALKQLTVEQRKAEMEFHLRIRNGELGRFVVLLQQAGYALSWHAQNQKLPLQGLLHGYIDLVASKGNRYFVLDYKTNFLGDSVAHYGSQPVADAMAHHHYDVQALIYQLALHRYLGQRLTNYQPETQLGGALYLFLRGMHPQRPGDGVFHMPAPLQLLEQLNQLFEGQE